MVNCVGLASGLGAGNSGCSQGPLRIQKQLSGLHWKKMIVPSENREKQTIDQIAALNEQLGAFCFSLAKEGFFFSIGGDHSCAIGTWSGVASAFRDKGDIGLLWIDAHMDSHTFETSESGNIHGMPLAALLGYGDARLAEVVDPLAKIKPENLVLIGIRSFEEGERALLERLKVKIYGMDEIYSRGLETVMQEAIEIVSKNTIGYGVSFDLDSIDPSYIQAVGTPVENGIDSQAFLEVLHLLKKNPPLAFELVEYNPFLDKEDVGLHYIKELLAAVLKNCEQIVV